MSETMTMEAVRERPILFSGEMVRALLAGKKTQTRRVVKPQPGADTSHWWTVFASSDRREIGRKVPRDGDEHTAKRTGESVRCPYGQPGDRLWVRETWTVNDYGYSVPPFVCNATVGYRADDAEIGYECPQSFFDDEEDRTARGDDGDKWRPSIFMPRWASRLSLEITGVRVERVQAISEADAQAEGVETVADIDYSRGWTYGAVYRDLWDELNASRGYGWDANPWVWVVEFRVVPLPSASPLPRGTTNEHEETNR